MTDRPHLHDLARRVGILPEYHDINGRLHRTSDTSYEQILQAMGFPVTSEGTARRSLEHLQARSRLQLLDPVRVIRRSDPLALNAVCTIPEEVQSESVEWRLQLTTEDGGSHSSQGRVEPRDAILHTVSLPQTLGVGYHDIALTIRGAGQEFIGHQRLILVPDQCKTVQDVLGHRKVFGLIANLYSVRSNKNWGVGDLSDLGRLSDWGGRHGAEFVGLNPLHALRNRGYDISAYSPVSRLFRNVIYIDVEAVPEFAVSRAAQKRTASVEFQVQLKRLRGLNSVNYDQVAAAKLDILRALYADFQSLHAEAVRRRQFAEFCARQGEPLTRFALFLALEEHFAARFGTPRHWRAWPAEYRRPDTAAVEEFRATHAAEIEFHLWLQFEVDRQLAVAADQARAAGMRIGLYQDLAIGSSASSSDTWADPGLYIVDARVGAPPDDYARSGQDWGLPPIHPLRLRESRYAYWTQLLRANFAHSGALRIDHVMGLLRQYWIPPGASALEGAYVTYPADDLFGILALESHRHGAIVIGEDLGTVPEGFNDLLKKWGVLSCQLMYFQRDGDGGFLPPESYSDQALVTSTTHDHVPIAGFFGSADLRLRRRIGDIASDEALQAALARREADQKALLCRLHTTLVPAAHADPAATWPVDPNSTAQLSASVHRFLSQTPAPLLGLMLDDLTGEHEPVNFPGVGPEQHASWSRRMSMSIEELQHSPFVATALAGVAERNSRSPSPSERGG